MDEEEACSYPKVGGGGGGGGQWGGLERSMDEVEVVFTFQ